MIRPLNGAQGGQAATEYALIAAALVLSLFVASSGLRQLQSQTYQNQQKALKDWRSP